MAPNLLEIGVDLLNNPKHTRWIAAALIACEAALCGLIILKVPYTEIDWSTYMQQVSLFLSGERDYSLLKGSTGPLVYPAVHVYLYSILHLVTDGGEDIRLAQLIFAILYLTTLACVLACYRRVAAPPWLLVLLVLSKRLHSIFLLRLFNDAWATAGLWLAIWALQGRRWTLAAVAWGICGLGVKMTLLLVAPAVAVILLQGAGTKESFYLGAVVFMAQLTAALPFMNEKVGFVYVQRAFDFGRQFLFKWTVNWRFVGEETFLSREFAVSLMVLHVSLLLLFLQTRWIKPSSQNLLEFANKYASAMNNPTTETVSKRVTPTFVMDAMLGSMAIGLLCARSLHYQFYAYLAWASPYLLWRAGLGPIWVVLNWAVQEYGWLVYPSTPLSSMLVVLELAVQIVSIWIATQRLEPIPLPAKVDTKSRRKGVK